MTQHNPDPQLCYTPHWIT